MSRTLLFLGASVSQVAAIKHALAAGYRVAAVDGDPNAIAFPYVDVAEVVDFTDVEGVTAFGARLGIDGVLAIDTEVGDRIASELAGPGAPPAAVGSRPRRSDSSAGTSTARWCRPGWRCSTRPSPSGCGRGRRSETCFCGGRRRPAARDSGTARGAGRRYPGRRG